MNREYLQLLARRESKEVFGKKYANLWLLILVLIATFLSISFSNGSLIFLKEKKILIKDLLRKKSST